MVCQIKNRQTFKCLTETELFRRHVTGHCIIKTRIIWARRFGRLIMVSANHNQSSKSSSSNYSCLEYDALSFQYFLLFSTHIVCERLLWCKTDWSGWNFGSKSTEYPILPQNTRGVGRILGWQNLDLGKFSKLSFLGVGGGGVFWEDEIWTQELFLSFLFRVGGYSGMMKFGVRKIF